MKDVFIHEKAMCDSENIGAGTRIWAYAHVLKGARIGRDCNIGESVFIENEVTIGDCCTIKNGVSVWDLVTLEEGVFIGPNAVFTNDFRPRAFMKGARTFWKPLHVKKGATVGANATLVCGITLGDFCMVAAGAVVTKDVPAHALVAGNPARIIGRVCYCGDKLSDDFCPHCKKRLSDLEEPRIGKAPESA